LDPEVNSSIYVSAAHRGRGLGKWSLSESAVSSERSLRAIIRLAAGF
jgi:L-amino acid N-acyltransferase YncA